MFKKMLMIVVLSILTLGFTGTSDAITEYDFEIIDIKSLLSTPVFGVDNINNEGVFVGTGYGTIYSYNTKTDEVNVYSNPRGKIYDFDNENEILNEDHFIFDLDTLTWKVPQCSKDYTYGKSDNDIYVGGRSSAWYYYKAGTTWKFSYFQYLDYTTVPICVNTSFQAAGYIETGDSASGCGYHSAFIKTGNDYQLFCTGTDHIRFVSINNLGHAAGWSYSGVYGVVYDGNDLNIVIVPEFSSTTITGINDNGMIVGRCSDGINSYVFVGTPKPPSYTLTVIDGEGNGSGNPTPIIGVHAFEPGTVVQLTANPSNSDFQWSGDISTPLNIDTTITMDSDKTVIITYFLETRTVNVLSGNGGFTDKEGLNVVNYGNDITITATADQEYDFQRWIGIPPGQEFDNPLTLTVYNDMIIEAVFDLTPVDVILNLDVTKFLYIENSKIRKIFIDGQLELGVLDAVDNEEIPVSISVIIEGKGKNGGDLILGKELVIKVNSQNGNKIIKLN